MLRVCAHRDCSTLTLGMLCVVHEPPVEVRRWPRGRPYARRERRPADAATQIATAEHQPTPAGAVSFGGDTAS